MSCEEERVLEVGMLRRSWTDGVEARAFQQERLALLPTLATKLLPIVSPRIHPGHGHGETNVEAYSHMPRNQT
jgi:hypothetical protein